MLRIKFVIPLLLVFITKFAYPQNYQATPTPKRTIEVIGAADIHFTPDQLIISFTTKEYYKGNVLVGIDKTDVEIKKILKQLNINQKNLVVSNFYGYKNYSSTDDEFITRKTYRLKIGGIEVLDTFMSMIDKSSLESLEVEEVSHTNIDGFYVQARKEAMVSAQTKANEFLEVLNEKCGRVVSAEELIASKQVHVMNISNINYQKKENNSIDLQKMSISYQVKVIFEIK